MFQHGGLFGSLTVQENVGLPLREHTALDDALIDEIAAWKLAMTGLKPEVGAQYPSELSGGMMKRASLARALALDPELLFLDEPTAGLDPVSAGGVDELVLKLRDQFGLTIVMITHDLDLLWQVADRVAVLGEGKVQGIGSMAELSQHGPSRRSGSSSTGPRGRAAQEQDAAPAAAQPSRRREAIIETKVNYPVVGAFVLVLGAVLVAGVLWLASGGAFQKKYDLYRAIEDESVAGLNLNAPVKYNGVDVGKVREIRLDQANPEQVQPALRHRARHADQGGHRGGAENTGPDRHRLCRAQRRRARIRRRCWPRTGSEYPVIRTKPSLSARLENVLTSVLAKLDSTSNNINAMLSDEEPGGVQRARSPTSPPWRTRSPRARTRSTPA